MSRVFRKTPLGVDAYTTHANVLTQSQRALLVMIDGKRSASQLRKFGSAFGNVNTILSELYHGGYIELDPAYIERMVNVQSEIARESEPLSSTFAAETIIGGARTVPPALTTAPPPAPAPSEARPTVAATPPKPVKRDLRDLAMLGEPDPVPTQWGVKLGTNTAALRLEPVDSDDGAAITYARDDAIAAARQFATRFVFDQMGNSGTPLCFAIEKAMTLQRIQEVALVAEQTLRDMKDEDVASKFKKQFRAILRGDSK